MVAIGSQSMSSTMFLKGKPHLFVRGDLPTWLKEPSLYRGDS